MDAGHLQARRRSHRGGIAGLRTVQAAGLACALGLDGLAWRLLTSHDPSVQAVCAALLNKALDERQTLDSNLARQVGDEIAKRMR